MFIYVFEGVLNLIDTYKKWCKAVKTNKSKMNYARYQYAMSYIEVNLKTTEETLSE